MSTYEQKTEDAIRATIPGRVPQTDKIHVRDLPYEDQIRLALEALHELIETEGYTYNWDSYDNRDYKGAKPQCCLAGAFHHKYGCTSSSGQLSGLAYHAMQLEGKDARQPPSLEALLEVARQRMLVW